MQARKQSKNAKMVKKDLDRKRHKNDLAADAGQKDNSNAPKAFTNQAVEAQKPFVCKTLPAVFYPASTQDLAAR